MPKARLEEKRQEERGRQSVGGSLAGRVQSSARAREGPHPAAYQATCNPEQAAEAAVGAVAEAAHLLKKAAMDTGLSPNRAAKAAEAAAGMAFLQAAEKHGLSPDEALSLASKAGRKTAATFGKTPGGVSSATAAAAGSAAAKFEKADSKLPEEVAAVAGRASQKAWVFLTFNYS